MRKKPLFSGFFAFYIFAMVIGFHQPQTIGMVQR
jgi:hypothetical protein